MDKNSDTNLVDICYAKMEHKITAVKYVLSSKESLSMISVYEIHVVTPILQITIVQNNTKNSYSRIPKVDVLII